MSVTIKDIARIAGVSYSTVSKALNNSTLVKADTKRKIHEIAEQLGYQPNIAAKSLVSKKSHTIGAVWPNVERAVLSTLATKIDEKLQQHNYSMLLSINPVQTAIRLFNRIQVDGILVFDRSEPVNYTGSVPSKVPVLCYGEPGSKGYPSIYVDRRKAIAIAVEHLTGLGHKRIAYIGDISNQRMSQKEKYLGFTDGIINHQLVAHPDMIINSNGLGWIEGYAATKRLLQSEYRPTAIVSGTYDLTLGIFQALQEARLQVPHDISLVSYDNIPQMANLPVPVTAVGGPVDVVAEQVVSSLLSTIENRQELPLITPVPPELVQRQSCRQIDM